MDILWNLGLSGPGPRNAPHDTTFSHTLGPERNKCRTLCPEHEKVAYIV